MFDVKSWLEHYGYVVLFGSLLLELIALPVPGEVLLSYTGLLIFQGRLNWWLSILVSGVGAATGITISYWIGYRLGKPFFAKYGKRIHMGPDKLEKTSQWFQRYGNKVLIVGFFIPGVRHITGYFAGITRIPYATFARNAYVGAFLYTGVFISLGKVLGPKWDEFQGAMKKYLLIAGIIAAVVVIFYYLIRKNKTQISDWLKRMLDWAMHTFHSLGRVRFFVVGVAAAFLGLVALMGGMIQDVLAHEFTDFDRITAFVVHAIFDYTDITWFTHGKVLSTYQVMLPLVIVTCIWIGIRGQNRRLEVFFLLLVLFGGELLEEGLRRLFHRPGPNGVSNTFPSEQTLMVLSVYGFAAFLFVRHRVPGWIRTLLSFGVVGVSVYTALSMIELDVQFPSDVVAGLVFGGVWLSLSILLLEVYRKLQR